MKKIYLFLMLSLISAAVNTADAQIIIFNETFDGISGPTAGGPGTYSFPAGWKLANVDAKTPSAAVSYVNDAWERREDFKFNGADSAAFSTSWYSPIGQADDWMWTPAISLLPNATLSWNAVAYDPAYPDGYEVRIMTVPPTGSTGNIGNMLTNSVLLQSVTAENSSWTARTQSLVAYGAQTVYIGFRNNSNDKFALLVDDVKVTHPGIYFTGEDFDGISGAMAGGPGTYSFPPGWTLVNVDARIPSAAVSYVNEAWERREDFRFTPTDSAAFSASWYSPIGQADDWMWTPAAFVSGATNKLTWNAVAYDPLYPDGYEVRIMTVPPTGSTGNIGNMLTSSTLLLNVPAESSTWTSRVLDLSAYNNQVVYIGFRNNSNDKFLLLIDDINLTSVVPVSFADFTGIRQKNGNLLQWQVEAQQDMKQYIVQRSNGRDNFRDMTSTEADAGTRLYDAIDAAPFNAVNYYRIKAIDNAGRIQYSKIISINNTENNIVIYPNPAYRSIRAELGRDNANAVITITDAAGKSIRTLKADGNGILDTDISNLAPGTYFMRAGMLVKSFVKY